MMFCAGAVYVDWIVGCYCGCPHTLDVGGGACMRVGVMWACIHCCGCLCFSLVFEVAGFGLRLCLCLWGFGLLRASFDFWVWCALCCVMILMVGVLLLCLGYLCARWVCVA